MSTPRRFSVTVFLSSGQVARVHFDAAAAVGRGIGRRGWTLVYGGNNTGPMGALADGAREAGGRVVGISPKLFGDCMDANCDEFLLADDMRHRKAEMEQRGDAFVVLPGGLGTLEEFFEILVGRFLKLHAKPIVLVNIDGYFDPLLEFVLRGIDAGFVREAAWSLVKVVETAEAALVSLEGVARERSSAEGVSVDTMNT